MIPQQQLENVDLSIRKYLDTNWRVSGVLRTPIEWPDSQFPAAGTANEWIQYNVIDADGVFYRQTSPGRLGKRLAVFVNVNIFLKKSFVQLGNPVRRTELVDLLFDIFKENTPIPFKDYANSPSSPTLMGVIACFDFEDRRMPDDDKAALYQHNVSAKTFWLQERAV